MAEISKQPHIQILSDASLAKSYAEMMNILFEGFTVLQNQNPPKKEIKKEESIESLITKRKEDLPYKDLVSFLLHGFPETFTVEADVKEMLENPVEMKWFLTSYHFYELLGSLAFDLDKKYKDHISKSEHIYTLDMVTNNIVEVDKKYIKSFKTFPAFRTRVDIITALSILSKFKILWKS